MNKRIAEIELALSQVDVLRAELAELKKEEASLPYIERRAMILKKMEGVEANGRGDLADQLAALKIDCAVEYQEQCKIVSELVAQIAGDITKAEELADAVGVDFEFSMLPFDSFPHKGSMHPCAFLLEES